MDGRYELPRPKYVSPQVYDDFFWRVLHVDCTVLNSNSVTWFLSLIDCVVLNDGTIKWREFPVDCVFIEHGNHQVKCPSCRLCWTNAGTNTQRIRSVKCNVLNNRIITWRVITVDWAMLKASTIREENILLTVAKWTQHPLRQTLWCVDRKRSCELIRKVMNGVVYTVIRNFSIYCDN